MADYGQGGYGLGVYGIGEDGGPQGRPVYRSGGPSPVELKVWEKVPGDGAGYKLVGALHRWSALEVEPRLNAVGPWALTMPYDQQAAKVQRHHLLTFDCRGERTTGRITDLSPRSDDKGNPVLSLVGVDVLADLAGVLAWPAPESELTAQAARWRRTAPVETVILDAIAANMVGQQGQDVVVPASEQRGPDLEVGLRFNTLLSLITTHATAASLSVRLGLVPTTNPARAAMTVTVTTLQDRTRRVRLSTKVGTLRKWEQSDRAPTLTRVIVAGPGKGAARLFEEVIDEAAEERWGMIRSAFVDARDLETRAAMRRRGREALTEATGASSFTLEAAEAKGMRYGEHFGVGDLVTVELATGLSTSERLNAVKLTATTDRGLVVQPIPGNPDGGRPLFRQAALTKALRDRIDVLEREET